MSAEPTASIPQHPHLTLRAFLGSLVILQNRLHDFTPTSHADHKVAMRNAFKLNVAEIISALVEYSPETTSHLVMQYVQVSDVPLAIGS